MPRKPDKITVETDLGTFDAFESLTVTNDILGVTEAVFELGDDDAFTELASIIEPGSDIAVLLNGRKRMVGRAEVNAVPISADAGVRINLTVRTKLADGRYGSADPKIKVKDTSIKDFVLAVYEDLGYAESDFSFAPFSARDLMTGETGDTAAPIDLEPLKVDQAKINPPETYFEAVERHLRRYRATHWDGPKGEILVGTPDVTQSPLYKLQVKRGAASVANNVTSIERIKDWSELAAFVQILGNSPGRDALKTGIRGFSEDADVRAVAGKTGHFNRRVLIPTQQTKDQGQADAQAQRELTLRRQRKNAINAGVDGWTYWNGDKQIPWATNTTVDVDVDMYGGAQGLYLITKVGLSLSVSGGATAQLTCVGVDDFVL